MVEQNAFKKILKDKSRINLSVLLIGIILTSYAFLISPISGIESVYSISFEIIVALLGVIGYFLSNRANAMAIIGLILVLIRLSSIVFLSVGAAFF